jgi:hypothetical protein
VKKVLIISYYWPPAGGAGVQRWLKFTRYLRDFGWEPIIYTAANPEYPEADYSLANDIPDGVQVIRKKIWEPYLLYKVFSGRKPSERIQAGFISENKKPGLAERVATWFRGNLFIPDARKFWIKPSIHFLTEWLNKNKVDAIVSTGPPHSMHMIALGVKKKLGIPWLADFRDPWTQIDFYHHLMLTGWADKRHKYMEATVLKHADRVVTVSTNCAEGLKQISLRDIDVITNGYDPQDFTNIPDFGYDAFSLTHLGSMNADRNPVVLWKVLAKLVEQDAVFRDSLKIRFIGKTDISVFESLKNYGLDQYVENLSYLPHHEAIRKAGQSAILLLALNNTPDVLGIAPGKMYEYLALQRPILCIGPESGDAATILKETQSGIAIGFDDKEKLSETIRSWMAQYKNKSLMRQKQSIDRYSRYELTKDVVKILDSMVKT